MIGLSGAIFGYMKELPQKAWSWIWDRITIPLHLGNNTPAFYDALMYLNHLKPNGFRSCGATLKGWGDAEPTIGYRREWFRQRWLWFAASRSAKEGVAANGNSNRPLKNEELSINFFTRDRQVPLRFMEEAKRLQQKTEERQSTFYVHSTYSWNALTHLPVRKLSDVILPNGTITDVWENIQEFIASKDWYNKRGIPYKRGYVLYGPPGTGKTSLIAAIATALKRDIFNLSLSIKDMEDTYLFELMSKVPPTGILALEDIDCAQREGMGSGITFSGLLNALDGAVYSEGLITIATTNHLDRLDPALLRPGRFDKLVEFGYVTPGQASTYISKFFEIPIETAVPHGLTMARLQELCLDSDSSEEVTKRLMGTQIVTSD